MPPWFADNCARVQVRPHADGRADPDDHALGGNGAARGDAARPGRALPSITPPAIRADVQPPMPAVYTPSVRNGRDDYRCFVLPWSALREHVHDRLQRPAGVREEVHHMIVFLARPADAATVDAGAC